MALTTPCQFTTDIIRGRSQGKDRALLGHPQLAIEFRQGKSENPLVSPFLKWPGGKRWLAPNLTKLIQEYPYRTYFEPFLGGAALFFALRPPRSILSDINTDLINTYRQVKYHAEGLVKHVRTFPVNKETFNALRSNTPDRVLDRAARFLYLNRTAFGGMYRLNERGEFNVPFGGERTTSILWESEILSTAAKALRRAQLIGCDFEIAMARAQAGDLVYCDPTYTVAHNNNGFIRYNERNFSWDDQKRLAHCCREAADRGVCVLVSNAYHQELLNLFVPPRHVIVSRTSRLCPNIQYRRPVEEFVFIFPPRIGTRRCPQ